MKKILITTNILTLILLYFSSFREVKKNESNTNGGSCDPICTNYSQNQIRGIANTTALAMANGYKKKQMKTLNENQAFPETRSVWFSLDKIKSFIGEMEALTSAATCNPKLDLGVRIYFGTYPDIQNLENVGIKSQTAYSEVKNTYSKHLTLFMVPTYHVADTTQIDFDPRHMGTNTCLPTPLKDLLKIKIIPSDASGNRPSNADILKFQKYGITPAEITPTVKSSAANKNVGPGAAPVLPPARFSLILSGIEKQEFFALPNALPTIQSVINHGNTIPPDTENGSAF